MRSLNEDEFYFDALDDEQLIRDVLATEEEEYYFDASDDDSMLVNALDDYELINQSGGRQFHFNLEEFQPRVNRRFGNVQKNYRMRIHLNENVHGGNVIQEFELGLAHVLRPLLENLPSRDRVEVSLRSN